LSRMGRRRGIMDPKEKQMDPVRKPPFFNLRKKGATRWTLRKGGRGAATETMRACCNKKKD